MLVMPYGGVLGGGNAYIANAVFFDGTNDYLNGINPLAGISDGKIVLCSVWLRITTSTADQFIMSMMNSTNNRVVLYQESGGEITFFCRSASGTNLFGLTTSAALDDGNWHHVAFSFDLGNSNQSLFVDGVEDTATPTVFTDGDVDLTLPTRVGCRLDGANLWHGDLAELYLHTPSSYFDLTTGSNLAMLISGGAPVDPAGIVSALGTPAILLTNPTSTWQENNGGGGDFTENGALTDGTGPVEI